MLNVEGKNTKNNHLSCQSLPVNLVSMTTGLLLMPMISLKLRAPGHPTAQVRIGGLPSIPHPTDPAQAANQGQEALMDAEGAMKTAT